MGYVAPTWQNGGPPALNAKNMQDISDNLAYISNHMVNPNLLDNWYWGNPVNQRGWAQGNTNFQYSLDRWIANDLTVSVNDGYVTLTQSGQSNLFMVQRVEANIYKHGIAGRKVTISALLKDGQLKTATVTAPAYQENTVAQTVIDGLVLGAYSAQSEHGFRIFPDVGQSFEIVAVGAELGSQQTLAHKEYGDWVLNEVPKFGDQLAECQRYYYRVHYLQYQTINMAYEDTAYAFIMLPLPVAMRIENPVLTQSKPIALGTSEKIMTAAEAKGCMARLGVNYAAISNAQRSVYSYCADPEGVTFELSADL